MRHVATFIAQSRTANDGGDAGSYGQGIPAFTSDEAEETGVFVGASNQPGDDGHRTNIGIVNIGDETARVWIAARDGESLEDLGLVTVEIGPNGWYQANLFELLGVQHQSITLAEVVFARPETELLGYLSRIDNRSGDPTFIAPSLEPAVRVFPLDWQVEATLTYTDSAVIERFEYTGEPLDEELCVELY